MAEKKWYSIRLDESNASVINEAAGIQKATFTEAGKRVLADGLRFKMMTHHKPISLKYMNELETQEVFTLYLKFLMALRVWTKTKPYFMFQDKRIDEMEEKGWRAMGKSSELSEFRFEPVPVGTEYADSDPAKQMYLVLDQTEIIGPDGLIYSRKDAEKTPLSQTSTKAR